MPRNRPGRERMKALIVLNSIALILSVSGILLVFLFDPLFACLVSLAAKPKKKRKQETPSLSVSVITIVRNGKSLVPDKIRNSLGLDFPPGDHQVVLFSDGSADGTDAIAKTVHDPRFLFLSSATHEGKNHAINAAVAACTGEILVFSDIDALLERDALTALLRPFADPDVGGVCGRREIGEKNDAMETAQRDYFRFDRMLKTCESRVGSIASNDGKLFAIRRELFCPLPGTVTDDLFLSMTVVRSGKRFVYEPDAIARVKMPSRSPRHEIERRRRIVCRSLHGIALMAALLNPLRHGMYAAHLGVNKVLRRLLPFMMFLVLFTSAYLSATSLAARIIFLANLLFYAGSFSYPLFSAMGPVFCLPARAAAKGFYLCVGSYGTLLGVIDFARGKRVSKWQPRKTDPTPEGCSDGR